MPPLISVIVPCFKQAHLLAESIGSLTAQTYPRWEALVIDDGSPDDVRLACESIARTEGRIRYIRKENGGLSSARNLGVALAKGELLQFLDADDLLLPRKFERHVKLLQEIGSDHISYTDYWHGKESDPTSRTTAKKLEVRLEKRAPVLDFASRWEYSLSIPIHCAIIPTSLVRKLGPDPFDTKLPNHEDWDFWMRICKFEESFYFIDEELAIYRASAGSMSRDRSLMFMGFGQAIRKQLQLNQTDSEVYRNLKFLAKRNRYRRLSESKELRRLPWPIQRRIAAWLEGQQMRALKEF